MAASTKILLIENNPHEAERLRQAVLKLSTSPVEVSVASTFNEGHALLLTGAYNAVLANLNLPDSRGTDTARAIYARVPDVPLIAITTADKEDAGLQAMQQGAAGYLVQSEISVSMLKRELRHAIERKHAESNVRAAQEEKDMLIAQLNAAHEALEKSRAAVGELAIRDELTGVYNLRELGRLLHEEIERTRRSKLPVALVMMGIDNFNKINELYGFTVGDKILLQLGSLLSTNLRAADKPARYGDDRFAVLSPDLPKMAAAAMAERLRGIVAANIFTISGEDRKTLVIPVTVSLGVAIFPDHGDSLEGIFKAAETALLHAKDLGRNTVASLKGPVA